MTNDEIRNAAPPTNKATELDSVTIRKMETLREKGMRQVGVVMMDDAGKRATIDMGKVLWSESTGKVDTGEVPPMLKFDPAGGHSEPYPSEASQYRAWHGTVAWLINPYTGERRDARDIGSDPTGLLIVAPGCVLKSATPSTIQAELRHNQEIFTVNILRQPMREYAPGKWENCIWPSDSIRAEPTGEQL